MTEAGQGRAGLVGLAEAWDDLLAVQDGSASEYGESSETVGAVTGDLYGFESSAPEREPATRAFVRRFPSAAMTLSLADFSLYRLELTGGRLVAGFGRAHNLFPDDFRGLSGH